MRRSHPYLRENKKIANWQYFIISTQTGSHEKSRISLIHFCSNIHSLTVLDYTGIQVYTYHLKYLYWLSIYSFDDNCIQCIFIWLVRFFSCILLTNFFYNIFTWILLPYLNHYHKLFPKSRVIEIFISAGFHQGFFFQQQIFNPLISVLQLYHRYRRT